MGTFESQNCPDVSTNIHVEVVGQGNEEQGTQGTGNGNGNRRDVPFVRLSSHSSDPLWDEGQSGDCNPSLPFVSSFRAFVVKFILLHFG